MIKKTIFPILLLYGLFLVACSTNNNTNPEQLPLTDCLVGGREATCGTLTVFENRQTNEGRTIDLNIAVIPARDSVADPTPLVFFAGGPGQSAIEAYPLLGGVLNRINRQHDILLVDQRGTGESNPLACEFEDETVAFTNSTQEETQELARECRDAQEADLALYTTDIAMMDLDEVREKLGYEQLNLYGGSYGTRAASVYMKMYPERVRSVVLDAVVPPSFRIYEQTHADAQRALELLFERCANDSACQEAFPDLESDFLAILDRLAEGAIDTMVTDPMTGDVYETAVDQDTFMIVIFNLLYSPETTSLLPLMLHEASQTEDLSPLLAQALMLGGGLYQGMFYSVMCTEDAPEIDIEAILTSAENSTFGTIADDFLWFCEEWPRGTALANLREPLTTDVPVLVLSGEADPITPPHYGEEVHATLPNSLHLVIPNQGHIVGNRGCMPTVLEAFFNDPTLTELDTSCTESITYPPFFTSYTGPQP